MTETAFASWAALASLVLGAVCYASFVLFKRQRRAAFVHDFNSYNRAEKALESRLRTARLILSRAVEGEDKHVLSFCIAEATEVLGNRDSLESPRPLMNQYNRLEPAMYACVLPEKETAETRNV